ncbi:MAG TPA: protein kinase [Thermoanaerobaculia bacterium]|nr:protein kinase [Thermoanaerobaculia bacterium]
MGTRDFSNRKLGHYRILEPLGSGGMGDVFLAMDDRLGRKVALKVIGAAQSASPTGRKRLRREARAAAAIDHPGVCTIYEVSEEGGESYIAMQYVEGRIVLHMELVSVAAPGCVPPAWIHASIHCGAIPDSTTFSGGWDSGNQSDDRSPHYGLVSHIPRRFMRASRS